MSGSTYAYSSHDERTHLVDSFGDFWCWDDNTEESLDSMEAHLDDGLEIEAGTQAQWKSAPCESCSALFDVGYMPTEPLTPTEEEE